MPKIYAGTLQNFRQQFFSSLKLHMVASKLPFFQLPPHFPKMIPTSYETCGKWHRPVDQIGPLYPPSPGWRWRVSKLHIQGRMANRAVTLGWEDSKSSPKLRMGGNGSPKCPTAFSKRNWTPQVSSEKMPLDAYRERINEWWAFPSPCQRTCFTSRRPLCKR